MPPALLTTKQVAEILGTSVRRVNRLAKAGKLKWVVQLDGIRGARLFDPSDVDRFAAYEDEQLGGDAA